MIRFRPSNQNRRKFAAWASKHRLRTVTSVDFAVPERLFDQIPAKLLDGAIVDGQRITTPPPKPGSKSARKRVGEPPVRKAAPPKPAPQPPPKVELEPAPEPQPDPAPPEPEPEPETEDIPLHDPDADPLAEPDPEPEAGFLSLPEPPQPAAEEESPGHECDDPACLDCGGPQAAPTLFECPECGREFKSGHGLKIHAGRAHQGSDEESS